MDMKQLWRKRFNFVRRSNSENCYCKSIPKNGEVMIFDEATSALDTFNKDLILDSVKELTDKGKIIILFHTICNQKLILTKYFSQILKQGLKKQFSNN